MFKARNASITPQREGNGIHGSALAELRDCVARMNAIIETVWQYNIYNRKNSPLKQVHSSSRIDKASIAGSNSANSIDDRSRRLIVPQFVTFKHKQEQEMIELMRRIAEIVVQGEKRAAADDNSTSSDQMMVAENTNNSIFEFFCEANVLDVMINVVTGVAFYDENKDGCFSDGIQNLHLGIDATERVNVNDDNVVSRLNRDMSRFLPPISVATQAIQSISILMQNVARVTSLYFILSNNRVNDLINLPLKYYSAAELYDNEVRGNIDNEGLRKKAQSAGMSELTTLFVSFLKSLAMRMNPETLQFYLTYPMETKGNVNFGAIEFPLYKRALEFCNAEEDTFVRITAMNICLNTLRLATTGEPVLKEYLLSTEKKQATQSNSDIHGSQRPDKEISPDGSSLHLKNALPFRERLAISHYVCLPSHVQALTSATFTKIGQLCGMMEEIIRSIDRIDWSLSKDSNVTEAEKSSTSEDLQISRIQLVKQFHDVAADFQDEIYLLEDVFAVGLVPMNEQIIEMMFAGVVYPLVLQPLHLYRSNSSGANVNTSNINKVADISLAKAAFFVIASIFHYISNRPFLHLLVTALLHPLAPDASKSQIQTASPSVVTTASDGHVQINIDEKNDASLDSYLFGRRGDNNDDSYINDLQGTKLMCECTYVLSPALAQIYKTEFTPHVLRQNLYRRSILACLSGTDGMSMLQPLAVYSIDAILGTIKPDILKNVMYGANCRPEWIVELKLNDSTISNNTVASNKSGSDQYMVEIIASLCRSVMTSRTPSVGKLKFLFLHFSESQVLIYINLPGFKSLHYNLVASHAICCATLIDKATRTTALKLIEHRRREAASLICQIPTRLNKKSSHESKSDTKNSIDEDLNFDRIFFDPFCDGDKFAVENTVRKQNGNFWDGPAYIAVAKDGTMDDFCKLICIDPNASASFETEEGLYRCAANSAIAYLELGKFFTEL